MKKILVCFSAVLGLICSAHAQQKITAIHDNEAKTLSSVEIGDHKYLFASAIPIISYQVDKSAFSSLNPSPAVNLNFSVATPKGGEFHLALHFKNVSADTILLHNVHPFTLDSADALITGLGDHKLSRAHLFLPGKMPVNVIVPDNAWELGYAGRKLNNDISIAALTRRDNASIKLGDRKRFETVLYPGGTVDFDMYLMSYAGCWQAGITRAFQEKMLFDIDVFNDSLFQRNDLKWVRHSYIIHLMDAWDKFYYDIADGKYHVKDFIERGKKWYGGDDVISVWPTWPTLGLDQRNQFDLFNDLPGGIKAMKNQAAISHRLGSKFFVCYNPWDESTNSRNHYEGLSYLISKTDADGVVLDTKAEAGKEFQDAADKEKAGVIMYSEGMAVPKDMVGIVSGRVHNALYYPPMLNLNKLLKPEFAIFRVAELYKEKIRREFATAFFNGYGTEINIMAPGQPDWVEEQYKFLGRTTRILRENTNNFVNRGYEPLINTTADSIWVNKWSYGGKDIFTVYSIIPQGYKGNLFEVNPSAEKHFVDLWYHRLLQPEMKSNKWYISAQTASFDASDLGTNNEGAVDCIAEFPRILDATIHHDFLQVKANRSGGEIRIWAGAPDHNKKPVILKSMPATIDLQSKFGRFEGDFVIQYLEDGILQDETIVTILPGSARLVSVSAKTSASSTIPDGMSKVPSGSFVFHTTSGDNFIPYPNEGEGDTVLFASFYMDKFPVTNKQFEQFILASKYKPTDTANYLKHWVNGKIRPGQGNFPVVYISYEDALAYAKWAGKRLPTEQEWQYAAQANTGREWPWNQSTPVSRRYEYVTNTLTVVHLEGIDSTVCNLGDGRLNPVGSYPRGANPFGLEDLVGCVWQLTNDVYMQGSHRYIMMKGGSYFKPSGSWWYVQGGPRELHYRQYLLRVSQGFERNSTVGFRCVKDAN